MYKIFYTISGPTVQSPNDPFVLVGAAHCNYICKDAVTGYILETCCCREESNPATCNFNVSSNYLSSLNIFKSFVFQTGGITRSPFCTANPIFTLAEPDDLEIICGEFYSGVEIIQNSVELEQVFKVVRFTNHPSYTPNRRVRNGIPLYFISLIDYHFERELDKEAL